MPTKPAPEAPKVVPLVVVAELPEASADPFEQRERRQLAFERMVESRGCKYPVGDPHKPDFHFCCEPRLDGKPYCDHHDWLTHVSGSATRQRISVSRPMTAQWAAE